MPGTIRLFIGLTLLVLAGSIDDTLPTATFLIYSAGLAIPGALIGFWGAMAAQFD